MKAAMTLRRIRKNWFRFGHLLPVVAFVSYIGGNSALANYVPDSSKQPTWQSTEPEPESGPDNSDYDIDGLQAWYESWLGSDPVLYDTDYDGINDGDEVATTGTNPLLKDTDGNGQSDLVDFYAANPPEENTSSNNETAPTDSDGDGLSNDFETTTSTTDPASTDSDGNGRSDYDDYYYPVAKPDSDSDGVTDSTESTEGTDPSSVDSDGDGLTDGEETNIFSTDPNNANSLSAQYSDWFMVNLTDSDGGGVPDRIEQYHGMNPQDANDDVNGDLDGDGTTNADSYNEGTDPASNITENYDRDGDGMTDVWEVANGLNPDDSSDAGADPDGDEANNGAEFQRGTDPHVADGGTGGEVVAEEEEEQLILTYAGSEEEEEPLVEETVDFEITEGGVIAGIELGLLVAACVIGGGPAAIVCIVVGGVIWGNNYGGDIGITPVP